MAGPARNRVAPTGQIVAVDARGAWMGNRGRLHEGEGTRGVVRTHQVKAWITCRLEFRGRRVAQWHPNHYTPLFLLDEAVALAAGHRPCAECRRADFVAFALGNELDDPRAADLDARLHAERLPVGAARGTTPLAWRDVPPGAFVVTDAGPALACADHLALWDGDRYAYGAKRSRPARGDARLLTPACTVAALRAGYPVPVEA
ncbi:hypothetical protein ACIB24_09030 [Spongisporangium articulatum]|uniref:Uncharacterized protein n=1 Tax=Spongisporangium articulatum TaxID=3362603 RepID=A0ABW8ALJ9_9ACTN